MLKLVFVLLAFGNFWLMVESQDTFMILFNNQNSVLLYGCSYIGNDLKQTTAENYVGCALECLALPVCTHFVYSSSICMLKEGKISTDDMRLVNDQTMYCGILFREEFSQYIKWKNDWGGQFCFFDDWYANRDRDDFDEAGDLIEKIPDVNRCYERCRQTPHCTHFTWAYSEDEGTICWMKKGLVTRDDALFVNRAEVYCGILNTNVPTSTPSVRYSYIDDLTDQLVYTNPSLSVFTDPPQPAYTYPPQPETTAQPVTEPSNHNYVVEHLHEGRFSVQFTLNPLPYSVSSIMLEMGPLKLSISDQDVNLIGNDDFTKVKIKSPDFNMIHFNATEASLWVSQHSLVRQDWTRNFIKVGLGYMYENNTLFKFVPKNDEIVKVLHSIQAVSLDAQVKVVSHYAENSSLILDHTMLIYDHETLGMNNLNENIMMPEDLPVEGRRLYEIVKSKSVNLNDEEIDAINFSIDNDGCSLNEKLKIKAKHSFGASDYRTSYLRVTFDYVPGNSPGQPYVIEIWPRGHYSPVHNHGNSIGVIKVLDGSLRVDMYNPICELYNEDPIPIKSTYAHKGNITWLTPFMYQTHKLSNDRSMRASISIQAYSHTHVVDVHEEWFNYVLPGDGHLKRFYPVSDYTFEELRAISMYEYRSKSCHNAANKNCCRYNGPMCGHYLKTDNMCMTPADDNAVYQCNKNDGTFTLVEKCSGYCFQNYLSTKCRTKKHASAELIPGAWSQVKGIVFFEDIDDKTIRIYGRVEGLTPNALHGMHIHEYGETDNACMDTGPHFNPLFNTNHGSIEDNVSKKHAGDLGNIQADSHGVAIVELKSELLKLIDSNPYSILDRSIVIHEKEDDLGRGEDQSTVNGNAGAKVACARIALANDKK